MTSSGSCENLVELVERESVSFTGDWLPTRQSSFFSDRNFDLRSATGLLFKSGNGSSLDANFRQVCHGHVPTVTVDCVSRHFLAITSRTRHVRAARVSFWRSVQI